MKKSRRRLSRLLGRLLRWRSMLRMLGETVKIRRKLIKSMKRELVVWKEVCRN